jgi:succinyl-diaminopimelate desuccinylase
MEAIMTEPLITAHGAYTHLSRSATGIAAKVIGELYRLQDIPAP